MMTIARQPRRHIAWGWILAALLLLGGGIAFRLTQGNQAAQTTQTETATVTQGTFRVSVSGPGTLSAYQAVDLKPQVQGTITYVPKVGDQVTKGQMVVRIDPTTYQVAVDNAQLALKKAQAQLQSTRSTQSSSIASQQQAIGSTQAAYTNAQTALQSAQINLASIQRVYAAGGATKQELNNAQNTVDQAQSNLESARVSLQTTQASLGLKQSSNASDLRNLQLAVEQAQLTLKSAQRDLANTKLYAPFSGTVSVVNAQVGGVGVSASVSGSSALLTIIDTLSVNLLAQIDETEISNVRVGQKVNVTLDAFDNQTFVGKVTAITPSASVVSNIAVFYVTVNVPNANGKLRPGMTAEGEIITKEIQDALLVPRRAVQTVNGRSFVQVQKSDGTAEQVQVQTGADDSTNVVITGGLKEGDAVLLGSTTAKATGSSSSTQGGPGGPGIGIPLPGGGP